MNFLNALLAWAALLRPLPPLWAPRPPPAAEEGDAGSPIGPWKTLDAPPSPSRRSGGVRHLLDEARGDDGSDDEAEDLADDDRASQAPLEPLDEAEVQP